MPSLFRKSLLVAAATFLPIGGQLGGPLSAPAHAQFFGGVATEATQILNRIAMAQQLIRQTTMVAQQATQITNQIQQITTALNQYQNMIQNTANLPSHLWGNITGEIGNLTAAVQAGQSLAYSLGNIDTQMQSTFRDFEFYRTSNLNRTQYATRYDTWSKRNSDTIAASLKAANLQHGMFTDEATTLSGLQNMSQTADGQHKALQVANQIAVQQVQQMQKLRQLAMLQIQMAGAATARAQAVQDAQQAKTINFYNGTPRTTVIGNEQGY